MSFYDFKGNTISVDKFVEKYEQGYFIDNSKIPDITYDQSSKYVEEDVIIPILEGHINSYSDLAKVMAWKIGKIKHKESECKKRVIYASDWENCEMQNPMRYGREMDLKTLSNYILSNRNELEELAENNPQECLRRIRNVNIRGIGSVYLITILFFLSHGKNPIYDRFAMYSLEAYKNNISPSSNDKIRIKDLPDKWDKSFGSLVDKEYGDYIKLLDSLNMNYKSSRRLDRALWVYGHAFSKRVEIIK